MGVVVTFYSYKGGVGRSMALVNVATLLSYWGHKVLVVDWDLEAPGLENFFSKYSNPEKIKQNLGLIDLLIDRADKGGKDYRDFLNKIKIDDFGKLDQPSSQPATIDFISAGKRDEQYFSLVNDFDVDDFYENDDGGYIIEGLREEWKKDYDFILIDSRTGFTDIGGICTVQMPDILVLLFTATNQGFDGIVNMTKKALKAQMELPFDRFRILTLPIATRIDYNEFELYQEWFNRFAIDLAFAYESWLPVNVKRRNFLEKTSVPYIPYFSFGEKLAVVEQGVEDPKSMGYSYETISSIIANEFQDIEDFISNRVQFVKESNKNVSKKNVFLSYPNDKLELANQLYNGLKQKGLNVWFDKVSIPPGENWKYTIENAIKKHNYFVVIIDYSILTPPRNNYFHTEINQIVKQYDYRNVTIIPIFMMDKTLGLRGIFEFQGIDFNEKSSINEIVDIVNASISTPIEVSSIGKIQKELTHRGYYSGPVNNFLSQETKVALEKFQQENNLPIGKIDSKTLNALGMTL